MATNVENQGATFSITDTKLYVPVVTLSTQENAKLLEQLKSGFKRTINWNKYQAKVSTERPNQYNVMIDGQNFFDQPIRNNLITYNNIPKISTDQGDDYTTGCLLDYIYFKNYYKMIAIGLSKQPARDADPKAIQQINFTGNIENQSTIFFVSEGAKETVLDFSQGTVEVF